MQQREFDSYNQVKHSVQLVEQAQLERTQAVLECQQMKEELNRYGKMELVIIIWGSRFEVNDKIERLIFAFANNEECKQSWPITLSSDKLEI